MSEEAFCAAEIAGGADVGEGEVEAVAGLIVNGAEVELSVLEGYAAAVPVVAGLDGGVLEERGEDGGVGGGDAGDGRGAGGAVETFEVEAGVGGDGEAGFTGVAVADEVAELVEVADGGGDAGDGGGVGGGDAFCVEAAGGVKAGVAESGEEVALMEVDVDVGGGELAGTGVEVEVPLDVCEGAGADAKTRDERRDVARLGEEGYARELEGGGEDVAAAIDDGAAEVGIEEVFLGEAPGDELFGVAVVGSGGWGAHGAYAGKLGGGGCGGGTGAFGVEAAVEVGCSAAGFGEALAAEEPLGDAVLHFIGVGLDVDIVKAEDVLEAVNAGGEAVGELGLDGVADFIAEPAGDGGGWGEGALEDRGAELEAGVERRTGEGCGAFCGRLARSAVELGAAVDGFTGGDGGDQIPLGEMDGVGEARMDVEALHDAAGDEVGLGALQPAGGGVERELDAARGDAVIG